MNWISRELRKLMVDLPWAWWKSWKSTVGKGDFLKTVLKTVIFKIHGQMTVEIIKFFMFDGQSTIALSRKGSTLEVNQCLCPRWTSVLVDLTSPYVIPHSWNVAPLALSLQLIWAFNFQLCKSIVILAEMVPEMFKIQAARSLDKKSS